MTVSKKFYCLSTRAHHRIPDPAQAFNFRPCVSASPWTQTHRKEWEGSENSFLFYSIFPSLRNSGYKGRNFKKLSSYIGPALLRNSKVEIQWYFILSWKIIGCFNHKNSTNTRKFRPKMTEIFWKLYRAYTLTKC